MKIPRRSLRQSLPSLHGLILFEASARHLNFSKAAEELGLTQSAVSHGIRQVEDTLGHALFLRQNRALALTTQGQRLFSTVTKSLGSIADTIDDISGAGNRDTIVVSTSTVLATEWLLPRLPSLRESLPDLRIDLRCLDRDTDLLANGIDVQLRLGDGQWPGYEATACWAEEIVVVASPGYISRHGPVASANELPEHRLIAYVDPYRLRIGWGEWLRSQGVEMAGRLPYFLQANDSLVAMKAAEAGEGLALGWHQIFDRALAENRLVQVLPNTLRTGRHHYILTVEGGARRKAIAQFRDWFLSQRKGAA